MAMTVGFGMSIGSVNSVWAATAGDRDRPAVRVRRTAVTIDGAGAVRMAAPRFAPAITDFADLTKFREPVSLNGRIWSAADLVAEVAACLIGDTDPESGPVLTYPGCYTARQITALQFALHRAGMFDVILMPEPVAAAEWLDAEFGVSATGSTLIYDLGANSVDVAVVRTEPEWDQRGVVGRGIRSDAYGGRPLGAMLARYARALAPDIPAPVSKVVPAEDTRRLRTGHVRTSLRVVRACLKGARIGIEDIDRILLVGGAARPAEVAEVLAELGPPVVVAPDPAHTVATGAAIASARFAGGTGHGGRYVRVAAAASSAAVVSALAMSAATMIGGGPIGTDGPLMEFGPALSGPAQALRDEIDGPGLGPGFASLAARADGLMGSSITALRAYSGTAHGLSQAVIGRAEAVPRALGAATPCEPPRSGTYSDPARFTNPMPFATSGAAAALAAGNAARTLGPWLPGWDHGSTKPPGGDGDDTSNPGTPGHPGGDTPPASDPAPIGDPVANGPAPSGPGSGNTNSGGAGASKSGHDGSPAHSDTGAESGPGHTDSPGTSQNGDDSGADSSGAANSGDTANQGSGTHSGPAADSPGGAGTAADSGNSAGPANSGGAEDSGTSANSGGATHSGNSAGATDSDDQANSAGNANSGGSANAGTPGNSDHSNSGGPGNLGHSNSGESANAGAPGNSGDAANAGAPANSGGNQNSGNPSNAGASPNPGAANSGGPSHSGQSPSTGTGPSGTAPGTAATPGSGVTPRPGGLNSAPPAPVHPGVVAPARPGGLGTGVVPGGGFHGGGMVPGGFHGGGFGGFH
ncbi:Hsp70 family protein [Nocardia nova]|uniref:Hsp70 family protein n=1 Tax=Nocardia nova TaxID=37330 RepID=UPI0034043BC0